MRAIALSPATNPGRRMADTILADGPVQALADRRSATMASHLTQLRAAEAGQAASELQYRVLFEWARDAIFVVDDDGRYVDANPAASLLLGVPREELLGRPQFEDPDDFPTATGVAVGWRGFPQAGGARGEVRLRRPDGTFRIAEYTATAQVVPGRHFGILRDVTEQHLAQQLSSQRARIIEIYHRMQPGASPELTAEAICAEITRHPQAPNAAIFAFDENGTLTTLASSFAADRSARLPRTIPVARAAHIRKKAAHGVWVETFDGPPDDVLRTLLAELGISAVVFAPIEVGGRIVGILAAGDGLRSIQDPYLLESIEDFAALAASLLGGQLTERRHSEADGRRIATIIADQAFHPVFQPIVDLKTGTVLGYEALTRFDDGVPPDRVFAMAAGCESGIALEVATIKAALLAAERLPVRSRLHLNVSPALVLGTETLGRALRGSHHELVLEITEHEQVADYAKLCDAVRDLDVPVRIAVDDAGAGFASLRHILELEPEVVKLDRAIVAGIDLDPARQALVAGMVHFANGIGALLVGEGIETAEERDTLIRLGAGAGQGFLLGRPAPAPDERITDERTTR